MVIDGTPLPAQELHSRPLPPQGIRVPRREIPRNLPAVEKPDIDILARPLHHVDTAAILVETAAIAPVPTGLDPAPLVALAVLPDHAAPGPRVQGGLVDGLEVDALDDVDLAAVGPVGADHPEGGPDPAGGAGHVGQVDGDEAVGVGF